VTPVPLDLPLRPSEAAELAGLVFEAAERKPLTDEVRNRIAARAAGLRLESMVPYFGSLERDPVHHSTYYLAVDAGKGPPQLVHMALATAPTSSIFEKPVLVGRMRRVGGPEIVINTIPFGPADAAALEKFAGRINTAFLPRPQGSRTTIVAGAHAAGVFDAFRGIWKRTGRNVAGVGVDAGESAAGGFYAALWAAIRSGWRDGYTAVARITALEQVEEAARFSTFAFDPGTAPAGEGVLLAERVQNRIRQARSALKINRPFDFELALDRTPTATTAGELTFYLESLKTRGHAVQLAALQLRGASAEEIGELAGICRRFQCGVDFPADSAALVETVNHATGGRVTCSLWGPEADAAAVNRIAEALLG
jgi:hypothetical protein